MAALMCDFDDGASPTSSDSATDVSEDSVEVKVQPVSMPATPARRNKRKSSEPRKIKDPADAKQRRWEHSDAESDGFAPARCRLTLLKAAEAPPLVFAEMTEEDAANDSSSNSSDGEPSANFLLNLPFDVRNILGPSAESLLQQSALSRRLQGLSDSLRDLDSETQPSSAGEEPTAGSSFETATGSGDGGGCKQKQRNYKNMTRERRIEANARERTRVHTISAAFENLRRAVPSYSCHQKLSKLAILRIACSYILALASLNEGDYSSQQDCPSFAECVELCTKTIQAEGKARKRKD